MSRVLHLLTALFQEARDHHKQKKVDQGLENDYGMAENGQNGHMTGNGTNGY